jgi:serine protease
MMNRRPAHLRILVAVLLAVALLPISAVAASALQSATPASASAPSLAVEAPTAGAPPLEAVPGVVLVTRRDATGTASAQGVTAGIQRNQGKAGHQRPTAIRTPKGKTDAEFIAELEADPGVLCAAPNYVRAVSAYAVPPNDPDYNSSTTWITGGVNYAYGKSWWIRNVGVPALWAGLDAGTYGSRAASETFPIAVVDTGFYFAHPDAGSNIIAKKDEFESYSSATGVYTTDFDVTPAPETAPGNSVTTASHGTAVAGQISAATNNALGVAGISYDAPVWVYKVHGIWTDASVAGLPNGSAVILDGAMVNAIYDATDAGAKVISISIAGPGYSSVMQTAVDYAYSHGVLVVAATGNGGTLNNVQYPGANNHVVGVGSSELTNTGTLIRSSFTDYGVGADPAGAGANNGRLDIMAPGRLVWGLVRPGYDGDGTGTAYLPGYYWWNGTSMATPAFSGMAALLWRFAPALTPDQLVALFSSTATPTGDPNLGAGYVSAARAYAKLKTDYPYLGAPTGLTAPALTNTSTVPVGWTGVSGTSVGYDVFMDAGRVAGGPATAATLTLVPDGTHAVSVQATSSFNWYDGASRCATVTFSVDTVPPSVGGFAYDSTSGAVSWSVTDVRSFGQQYRIDTGAAVPVTTSSVDARALGLADGAHQMYVQATDAAGNASPWVSYGFDLVNVPAAPTVLATATVNSAGYGFAWSAVPNILRYEYTVNGAAEQSSVTTGASVTLLLGANTLGVRAAKQDGAVTLLSAWSTSTVTYLLPKPGLPAVVLDRSGVATPTVVASWAPVADASAYEYTLNSGSVTSIGATTSLDLSGMMVAGSNTLQVRGRNATTIGDWATITFTPPAPVTTVVLSPVSPNGADDWYVTTPTVSLSRGCDGTTFWRWGSGGWSSSTARVSPVSVHQGDDTLACYSVNSLSATESPAVTRRVKIDTVAPVSSSNIDSAWHTTTFTVTLGATDSVSGVRETWRSIGGSSASTAPLTFDAGEGQTPVTFWSVDHAGNVETAITGTVKVDATPPTVSSDATTTVYLNTASITIVASDTISGAAGIEYRVNTSVVVTTAIAVSLPLGPGVYSIDFAARDVAGNWSSTSTPVVVTVIEPPATPGALALSSPTPGPKAHLSWSDVASETAYVVERAQDSTSSAAFSAIATLPANATSFDDTSTDWLSTWYYRLRAYNPAGYSGYAGPVGARLDTVAPTVSSDATTTTYLNAAIIHVGAADTHSGPASIEYRVDGSLATTISNPATITLGPGSYTFDYSARDAAGYWSGWSASTTITVLGPPATPGALALSSPTPGPKARLSWSDVASETAYVVERAQDSTSSAAFSAIATLSANATSFDDTSTDWLSTWYYRLRAYNPAGYSGYAGPVGIRLDTVAPVTTSNASGPYTGSAVIALVRTDAAPSSGMASTNWSLTGAETRSGTGTSVSASTPGSYRLEFWSTDTAGNTESRKTADFVVVSAIPPLLPTWITIQTSATSSRIGGVPILSGSVSHPGLIGKVIVVYVKKPGKAYWTYSSNRVVYSRYGAPSWQYKYYFKRGMAKGRYVYKAFVPTYPGFIASTSPNTVSIRLR